MVIPAVTTMAMGRTLLLRARRHQGQRPKAKLKEKQKGKPKPRRLLKGAPAQGHRDIARGVPSTRGRYPEAINGVASQWSLWQLLQPLWSRQEQSPWLILRGHHGQHHITLSVITQLLKRGIAYTVETG